MLFSLQKMDGGGMDGAREKGKEVRRKGWWEEATRGNNVHTSRNIR